MNISSHLLRSSERLKRITFGSEGDHCQFFIYLNASMFTRIIRDQASSTEEVEYKAF